MVKGVHKKVIEVHQPDSAYFEKAIFYLRPGITQLPPELAQAAAREYLQELEPNPLPPFWKRTLPLFCSALFAAISIPPQQGTSMRRIVRLLMSFSAMMASSFSV